MPQGIALSIGLNSIDPKHYGDSGTLNACEADAADMQALAAAQGFKCQQLLTKSATRGKVTAAIKAAASKLKAGDMFLLTYSGHGGQVPDQDGDEPDGADETWCLYDAQLIDDELHTLYTSFSKGVRILVLSDSCHSGSVTRAAYYTDLRCGRPQLTSADGTKYRCLTREQCASVYRNNAEFYDKLAKKVASKSISAAQAGILLISGCQDNQYSSDGTFNGLFTSHLLRTWRNGTFTGNYGDFHKAICQRMPPIQTPNLFFDGDASANFAGEAPFMI